MIYAADAVLPITSPPIREGAVLTREGRIISVGERDTLIARNPSEEIRDFKDAILMPGLVNLHGHVECASFGSLAEPTPFLQWLGRIIKAGRNMNRDDWLRAARKGVKRYLEAGITCTADITRTGVGLQAMAEAGMPALIYFEVVGVDDRVLIEAVVDLLEKIKSGESIAEASGLRLGVSPHSIYTLSSSALKMCSEISSEYELPLSIHLAETQAEVELVRDGSGPLASAIRGRLRLEVIKQGGSGKTPAGFLDGFDLIRDSLITAHGVWLSDEDIALLKNKGASVAICPTSNELLGVGEAPINRFIDHGLGFGIGTDSLASNPELDLFLEVRKARALLAKQIGLKTNLLPLPSKKLVEMITVDAASMLGLNDQLGSIESSKRADLIAIDYDGTGSSVDLYNYLVESASKLSISHTILGGDIVYSRHK
ncbi:MAG: amidohydrolase family protein [Actinobacteria bacterium]|nr:amidohydrolase family protein [Actinomycetota bacterium]